MLRAKLPVPGGFCVTTEAFRLWLSGGSAIAPLFDELGRTTPEQDLEIRQRAEALRQQLADLEMPKRVIEAIRAELQRHSSRRSWAVRSSATAEDLPEASFAGQHDSMLGVAGSESVLEAVKGCWISLFTDRALFYRLKHHIPHDTTAMGVIVQEMVPAQAAGVLFTADPATGKSARIVIEAVPGLGDALVSGRITPDRLVLDKKTLQVIERTNSHQPAEFNQDQAECDRNEAPQAIPELRSCLDDVMARRLGKVSGEVERLFGRPQDIEWAARDGQVFLLQARPITTAPSAARQEMPPEIWTNANVMEALPDVVTPMAWSLMQVLLDEFLYPVMRHLGLDLGRRRLVDLISGRAYLNVRAVIDLVQKASCSVPMDVMAAFGGEYGGLAELSPLPPARRRFSLDRPALWRGIKLAAWLLPGLVGQQRLLERWGQRVFGELASTSPSSLSDEQLGDHPHALLKLATLRAGERTWAAAVWMGAGAVGGSAALFQVARQWLGDLDGSLANRLLAGAQGMNSAENGLQLLRLAAWVRQYPGLKVALLEPASFAVVENKLSGVAMGPQFLERWRTFMAQHGHQARGGMDIFQPRWSEMPDFVLDMLRVYLGFDEATDPLAAQARQRHERESLMADCLLCLRNPLKRWLVKFLVRVSHRGLAQRENVKNEGVRMVGILRRAVLEAGRRLVERGVLREREDVFFLRLEELGPVLLNRAAFDAASAIKSRKADFARCQLLSPPPLIVGTYQPGDSAPPSNEPDLRTFHGLPVSPGIVTGKARVILQAGTAERLQSGEILVAPYTDPGWTPYFLAATGLVVDVGGLLSHGSVVAREYGLPAVVNVGFATKRIKTGQLLRVDGTRGVVTLLD